MSKAHPAMKQARKLIKAAGFNPNPDTALSFKIHDGLFDSAFIDVRISSNEDNKARFEVCEFQRGMELAATLRAKLHHVEFQF